MRNRVLVHFAGALCLVSCSRTAPEADDTARGEPHVVHWGYEEDDGPDVWASMDPAWETCAEGSAQSPVDLTDAAPIDLPAAAVHTPSDQLVEVLNQEGVIDALDNGHTIQINTKGAERMTVGDKTYALLQFHFHAPSEHTIDGESFPMEIHFVHQADDGALAVVGALVTEGEENTGVGPLWAQLAEAPGTEATVRVPSDFSTRIFPGRSAVYHYVGSLTTPPCSEGVSWYIRRTPTQLSREQIEAFAAYYDHNNRPVQAMAERALYLDEDPDVTIY